MDVYVILGYYKHYAGKTYKTKSRIEKIKIHIVNAKCLLLMSFLMYEYVSNPGLELMGKNTQFYSSNYFYRILIKKKLK